MTLIKSRPADFTESIFDRRQQPGALDGRQRSRKPQAADSAIEACETR